MEEGLGFSVSDQRKKIILPFLLFFFSFRSNAAFLFRNGV
jgi:hypothetical protein